jgi:predicted transcriptional regulator YheO
MGTADFLTAAVQYRLKNDGQIVNRVYGADKDKQALTVKLYDEKKHTIAQICQMMEISKPTLYKYIEASKGTKQ